MLSFFGCDKYVNKGKYTTEFFSCCERCHVVNRDHQIIKLLNDINNLIMFSVTLNINNLNEIKAVETIPAMRYKNAEKLKKLLCCCCIVGCDKDGKSCCSYGNKYEPVNCCGLLLKHQGNLEKDMKEIKNEIILDVKEEMINYINRNNNNDKDIKNRNLELNNNLTDKNNDISNEPLKTNLNETTTLINVKTKKTKKSTEICNADAEILKNECEKIKDENSFMRALVSFDDKYHIKDLKKLIENLKKLVINDVEDFEEVPNA